MNDFVEQVRSLGFSGLLGSGLLGLVYLLLPGIFPSDVSLKDVLIVGALIGGGFHGFFDRVIIGPLCRSIGYYAKLGQLVLLRGVLDQETQRELISELSKRHFLGNTVREQRGLPPGPE